MKPDPNNCLNCNKEISNRAKYCSDKCRKQYERSNAGRSPNSDKRSDKPNPDTQKEPTRTGPGQDGFRDTLTATDKTFYDRAIKDFGKPYYKFSDKIQEHTCAMGSCGKKFKTSLSMLRFCSYRHYSEALSGKR